MSAPENQPAFPSIECHPSFEMPVHHFGMWLRDHFAGQALPAIIIATSAGNHQPKAWAPLGPETGCSLEEAIAIDAYAMADAMLTARSTASHRGEGK